MKIIVKKPVEIEIQYVQIQAAVRYGDEEIPFNFPGRSDDIWDITIDLVSGQILGWPDLEYNVHMKVYDGGSYHLLDSNKSKMVSIIDDYVPNGVIPGSYGDYIELNIAPDGIIRNWPKKLNFSAFTSKE